MIPKKIHYCWFGGNPLPNSVKKCIESWKKYCPEFEIIEWNESNYDINKIAYISQAYREKKYAFVSDYARLDIIFEEGGIYLDTDVELLKSLDTLLDKDCFLACELDGEVATGLGFGAVKYFPFLKENMQIYEKRNFVENNKYDETTCVEHTTNLLKLKGLKSTDKIQEIERMYIYPPEYFCPYSLITGKITITNNTYSIHHYDSTWYGQGIKSKFKKKLLPLKVRFKLSLDNLFGQGTYSRLKDWLRK